MTYNWGAMAAREDRAKDRDRVRAKAQRPENRGKKKFRKKKKSSARIPGFREADRYNLVETRRLRSRAQQLQSQRARTTPPRAEGEGNILPGPMIPITPGGTPPLVKGALMQVEAQGPPLIGGGIRGQAAAGILRNLPGMGRYLGNTEAGVGRYLAGRSGMLGRALPWLAGVSGGVALEKIADWGLGRMGEGSMYPQSQMPVPTGGGPLMQQSPLGPLSRGQEFPGGPFVVKTWDTYPGAGVTGGGAWPIFALLSDGRIVVSKPNGSWKVYRPKKNLVISSNPRLRDIRKLDRMHKRVTKMIKRIVPATRRK